MATPCPPRPAAWRTESDLIIFTTNSLLHFTNTTTNSLAFLTDHNTTYNTNSSTNHNTTNDDTNNDTATSHA